MSSHRGAVQPTFTGYVLTIEDALILHEACLQDRLVLLPRRLRDEEKAIMIRSGSVFIYEARVSGIKNWTDGITWSLPSPLNGFDVYHELDHSNCVSQRERSAELSNNHPGRPEQPDRQLPQRSETRSPISGFGNNDERQTVGTMGQSGGSLTGSLEYKINGLVRKTIHLPGPGAYQLVSYYRMEDVIIGKLRRPTRIERRQHIEPCLELTSRQNIHFQGKDSEDVHGPDDDEGRGYLPVPEGNRGGRQSQMYHMAQTHDLWMSVLPDVFRPISSVPSVKETQSHPNTQCALHAQKRLQYSGSGNGIDMPLSLSGSNLTHEQILSILRWSSL